MGLMSNVPAIDNFRVVPIPKQRKLKGELLISGSLTGFKTDRGKIYINGLRPAAYSSIDDWHWLPNFFKILIQFGVITQRDADAHTLRVTQHQKERQTKEAIAELKNIMKRHNLKTFQELKEFVK